MNEQRNPLRQRATETNRLSQADLEDRYNQALEARDDDWKRWRAREKELSEQIKADSPPVARRTAWEVFSERMGKLAPFIAPVVAIIYTWWDNVSYPPPGKGFWTADTVQPFFQSALLAAFTLMFFNRLLAMVILALVGCLVFAYLFK